MQILEQIQHYKTVWGELIPHIIAPHTQDVLRWCEYQPDIVEKAIARTARKFAVDRIDPSTFDPESAYRYVSGTARIATERGDGR